jgi:arsenate reductase
MRHFSVGKAKKYKEMDLKSQNLSETDYRRLLLDEYTFLKRPVIIIEQEIFVGSEKKNLEKLMEKLKKI